MKKIMLTIFVWAAAFCCYSQTKSLSVGVKVLNEIDIDGGTFYPGVGGQVVYRMTKHSGLESGLYYSNQTLFFTFYVNGLRNYNVEIAESWLMLPLLYRFDSKFVNFTIGPQIDYFLGWKNKNSSPSVLINSYSRESARFGATSSISKTIKLSSTWILEPEGKLMFYPEEERGTAGLNISLRKILF